MPRSIVFCEFERKRCKMVCRHCGLVMRVVNHDFTPDQYRALCVSVEGRKAAQLIPVAKKKYLGDHIKSALAAVGVQQAQGCSCSKRQKWLNDKDKQFRAFARRWVRRLLPSSTTGN